jgi:hypothetical protein
MIGKGRDIPQGDDIPHGYYMSDGKKCLNWDLQDFLDLQDNAIG